jgi:hypothetical protein
MMRIYTLVNEVKKRSNPLVVFIKKIVNIRTNKGLLCPIFLQTHLQCVYLRKVFAYTVFTLKKDVAYELFRKLCFKFM